MIQLYIAIGLLGLLYLNNKENEEKSNEVNVDEMKTIRYMKTLRSKGWSYFRISDKLNDKNIIGKSGGKWYGMSVRNVLSYY